MTAFAKLRTKFRTNWTTVLVGWNGLGKRSPWPERAEEFPSLLTIGEVIAYAKERLATSSRPAENEQTARLLSPDLSNERREAVASVLQELSRLDGGDMSFELRKWRLVLLEELLETLPDDALNGLVALSEFWQSFGFPQDSPHVVQGRGNSVTPADYYQDSNLWRSVACHLEWIEKETEIIRKAEITMPSVGAKMKTALRIKPECLLCDD